MIIQVSNATMHFGANEIFNNIDFVVNENEKVALIGKNGCGKSTLLKALINEEELTSGDIFKSSSTEVSYLKQNALIDSKNTLIDEMLDAFKDLIAKEKRLASLSDEISKNPDNKLIEEYSKLEETFKYEGGYSYNGEIASVLHGFGFEEKDYQRNLQTFSGGEKTKIAFAKMLLKKPDLLLLDEPTNHLDLNTIEWLENYLAKYPKALVLVSHDRVFLDKVCNVTYEMEYQGIKRYEGNFSYYLEKKKNDIERQEMAYRYQQKDIKRLEELIEKLRYKKNKAKFAQSKIKYLERMDRIEDPKKTDTRTFKANFFSAVKGGKNVLSLQDYEFGYPGKSLGKVTIDVKRGDRICIMGDNGTGKSTLLKTLIGLIPELSGYKMFGHQIYYSYFDQNQANFESNKNVLDELWDEFPSLTHEQIRTVLGTFCFTSDEVFKNINILSGGEKVRLLLAKIMLERGNLLFLDEPTNHLDIYSKEALEKSLKAFDGTIIFVSHDRYFIKEIATSVLLIEDGSVKYFPDGYKDYIDLNRSKSNDTCNKENVKEEKTVKPKKDKPKYDIKKIEAKISELEELLEEKRALRFEPEYYQDSSRMMELDGEIDDIHNLIHAETEKWEEAMALEENK